MMSFLSALKSSYNWNSCYINVLHCVIPHLCTFIIYLYMHMHKHITVVTFIVY